MIEIDTAKNLIHWMSMHRFNKKWVCVGIILIITGIAFLAKGPVTWFVEWLEENRAVTDENSIKVWDLDGKEIAN